MSGRNDSEPPMTMKRISIPACILSVVLASLTWVSMAQSAERPPNVVILLADDLGWGDISVHGGKVPTPHIDRFFRQGVELTNFMSWTVCSPTRAMLNSGRHPFRVKAGPDADGGTMPLAEMTMGKAFQKCGYRTGVFGKWHNCVEPDTPEYCAEYAENAKARGVARPPSFGPGANAYGFDEAWVYYGGGVDYFTQRTSNGDGPRTWWHGRELRLNDTEYTDDMVTRHAMEFMRDNKELPFLCYVPFHLVHGPWQAKESYLAKAKPLGLDEPHELYAAMTMALDDNVGLIIAELERLGLRENTIVVFTSDNGANIRYGSNLPLRGGKTMMYEGGLHVPAAVQWPKGGIAAGTKWNGLCGCMDLFPTLMAMTQQPMPETRPLDGKNIWPALRDNRLSPVESFYATWYDVDAVRTADWKLLRFFDRLELYDMHNDISESKNLAKEKPDVLKTMLAKADAWRASTGAALSHVAPPMSLDAKPAPEGEVLEVSVTVSDQAKPKDQLIVPFGTLAETHFADDYLEFDICVAPDSLTEGFYYTPSDGGEKMVFQHGRGIDQFNREQSTGPAPRGGAGVWEHRVVGFSAFAPNMSPRHVIVFTGRKPGTFRIYLDNLRIRHPNGSTTPIWTSAKDMRFRPPPENPLFKKLSVRAVPVPKL